MDLAAQIADLNAEQLVEARRQLELQIEDVIAERRFTLGQSGVHIGAVELSRLRRSWASEEERLRERLAAVNARLAELPGTP
jgi:hypothetical protein